MSLAGCRSACYCTERMTPTADQQKRVIRSCSLCAQSHSCSKRISHDCYLVLQHCPTSVGGRQAVLQCCHLPSIARPWQVCCKVHWGARPRRMKCMKCVKCRKCLKCIVAVEHKSKPQLTFVKLLHELGKVPLSLLRSSSRLLSCNRTRPTGADR